MTDKLNDNDRQRIEQVSIEICGNRSEDGLERVRFQDGAEYATLFERQRQAKRIEELRTLLGDILAGFQQFGTIYSKDEERIKEAIK